MGNCNGKPPTVEGYNPPPNEREFPKPSEETAEVKRMKRLLRWVKDFQEDNYNRLRNEFAYDMNLFILNNTLMCIQFFEDFERSRLQAQVFKREKEQEMNAKLSTLMNTGTMAGERKAVLLHGMGEILNKNFIYRRHKQDQVDDEVYNNLEAIYKQQVNNSSYIVDGILPLDFYVNFDSFKVYTESEWRKSQNNDYSSVLGDPQLIRVNMEEPNEQNRLQRGYVRVNCEEATRNLTTKGSAFTQDYSPTSEYFLDGASDLKSSIYESTISSDDDNDDGDSIIHLQPGQRAIRKLEKKLSNPGTSKFGLHKDSWPERSSNSSSRLQSPTPSFTPRSFQARVKKARSKEFPYIPESRVLPEIRIEDIPPSPTEKRSNSANNSFNFPNSTWREKMKRRENNNISRSSPEFGKRLPPHKDHPSSGYESLSASSSALSKTSSAASAEFPARRRPLELKGLREYPAKQNTKILAGQTIPQIPPEFLIEVKIEKLDLDDSEEHDSDSDSSDDDSSKSHTTSLTQDSDYITRSYLNSAQFAATFCSEFNLIGNELGIEKSFINQAQVLGATIRCSVTQESQNEQFDNYKVLYTFTPTINSKHWAVTSELWFKRRLLTITESSQSSEDELWLNRDQVENVVSYGCNLIPQGYRSMEFINIHQSMEWQLNFCQAENYLLNTFKNVHWRTYIFSSIIFRAFIAPLGPKGLGLEHIRNIIYKMCEEDFLFWNDEQPGVLLRKVLDRLYDSLGKRHLPNFFLDNYNMLKSSAPENNLLVQHVLKRIRGNLVTYCIHSFRNLTCLQESSKFYPMADFKQLYKLITSADKDLLFILNPHLSPGEELSIDSNNNDSQTKKDKKKRSKSSAPIDFENDQMHQRIMDKYTSNNDENDRTRIQRRKKYEKMLRQRNKHREEQREKRMADAAIKNIIPQLEKRKSIDLDKHPVSSYTNLRTAMIVQFYVEHFLQMATKALEFEAFSLATMYTLHVENLCKLMNGMDLEATPIDKGKVMEYTTRAQTLKLEIGPNLAHYVNSKLPSLDLPDGSSTTILNLNPHSSTNNNLKENFIMNRKLPTPPPQPAQVQKSPSRTSSMRINTAGVGSSLLHFPKENQAYSYKNLGSPIHEDFELPSEDLLTRPRRQNIKYISQDLQRGFIPSETRFPRASFKTRPQPQMQQNVPKRV